MTSNRNLRLLPATFAPFRPDGTLHLEVIPRMAELLMAQGVGGAFINGTAGEAPSLTVAERKSIAQAWRDCTPPSFFLMVQVGHNTMRESADLAAHAAAIGCDAISATPPSFFKPQGVEGLVEVVARIAAAAARLPFYYYHVPCFTGVGCKMAEFLPEGKARVPNLRGIKFTDEDLLDLSWSTQVEGVEVLYGKDETLVAALALGCRGAIGSTYNYSAGLYQQMFERWREGDHAAALKLQRKAQKLVAALMRYQGGVIAGKAIMRMCGIDCGEPRLPLTRLTPAACIELQKELSEQDILPAYRVDAGTAS